MTELQELLLVCISANWVVFICTITHKLLLQDLRGLEDHGSSIWSYVPYMITCPVSFSE